MTAAAGRMPGGIPYIIGNEAAERFSWYGMQSILAVYMAQHLQMPEALATQWVHYFGLAVYVLPIFGAIAADAFLDKYRIILWLSLVYCCGHLALALFDGSGGLALGLALIALGAGGIKPCVSANVGDQFDRADDPRLERVFSFFYFSINVGSLLATVAIPWTLEAWGPHVAFGIPGVFMALATATFWLGRKKYRIVAPAGRAAVRQAFGLDGLRQILGLLALYVFVAIFFSLYFQVSSTWTLQAANGLMDKTLLGDWTILPAQIYTFNAIFVLLFVPLLTFAVYPRLGRLVRVTPLRKIGAGILMGALAFVVIAWIEAQIQAQLQVSVWWQVLAYALITLGEVLIGVTALEFSYARAPKNLKSLVMSVYLLSLGLGNGIAGLVNGLITEEFTAEAIYAGAAIEVAVDDLEGWAVGDKLSVVGDSGIDYAVRGEPQALQGTFVVAEVKAGALVIDDVQRSRIRAAAPMTARDVACTRSALQGPAYFLFFAAFCFGAFVCYLPVARRFSDEARP